MTKADEWTPRTGRRPRRGPPLAEGGVRGRRDAGEGHQPTTCAEFSRAHAAGPVAAGRRPRSRKRSTMHPPGERRLVILTEGQFGFHHGKTAMGVIRYGSDPVVAVLDSANAGRNVSEWLPGHNIPIVAGLDEALAVPVRPTALLIGIAPTGGRLPASWRAVILGAIRAGLDVLSGLHTFIGDDLEFAAAAAECGIEIVDYRRPPDRMETAVGRPHGPGKKVILTVGTDCAIGK